MLVQQKKRKRETKKRQSRPQSILKRYKDVCFWDENDAQNDDE